MAHKVASTPSGTEPSISVEHPSGEFTIQLGLHPNGPTTVVRSGLIRTARMIMAGNVMIPAHLRNANPSSQEEL